MIPNNPIPNLSLHKTENYNKLLSPELTKDTKGLSGGKVLEKIINNLKEIIHSKYERIKDFKKTKEGGPTWKSNASIIRKMDSDVKSVTEYIKQNKVDSQSETIKTALTDIANVVRLLRESNAKEKDVKVLEKDIEILLKES